MTDVDNRVTRGYDGTASINYSIFRYDKYQSQEILLDIYGRSYYSPEIYSTCREAACREEKGVELISVLDENGVDWLDKLSKDEYDDIAFKLDEAVIRNIKANEEARTLSDSYVNDCFKFEGDKNYYF